MAQSSGSWKALPAYIALRKNHAPTNELEGGGIRSCRPSVAFTQVHNETLLC
jgi:hypothetical protein